MIFIVLDNNLIRLRLEFNLHVVLGICFFQCTYEGLTFTYTYLGRN